VFFPCFLAAIAAGYGISLLLFSLTGKPPELVCVAVAALIGIFILAGGFQVARKVYEHAYERAHGGPMKTGNEIIKALERIAGGDFDVLLPVREDRGPYADLAASVNKMAKELGTMETLRQEFISNVSHEIQSPLTSIRGFAELIRSGGVSEDDKDHYLDIIGIESRRLSKLSENLLKLSALEDGGAALAPAKFRLDKQIENAVLMFDPQWGQKNISLSIELEAVALTGDEELLKQVWINLVHNALKFTQEGGAVGIELTQAGGFALCKVRDDGVGIPEESLPHIFERFYRADKARGRTGGGNGLGLSLAKKILELHGGSIAAESAVGKGTTFSVRLPLSESLAQGAWLAQ
jgi:signal transduction histidine kinase